MPTSVLTNVKGFLQIPPESDVFDDTILVHINSVFSTLYQLGVGPQDDPFHITGAGETWELFFGSDKTIFDVKSYMYIRVRLLFDPPAQAFMLNSLQEQANQLEWRLAVKVDPPFPEEEVPSQNGI